MSLSLTAQTTAVLFMDFQHGIVARIPEQADALLQRARTALDAARAAGAFVGYVRVGFRPGYPEVSERNLGFAALRGSGFALLGNPDTQVVDALTPLESEPVVVKHRVGAFSGTELEILLRARKIDTLVLFGISTSGVILSTVRHAADHDYRIVVASDGCADFDPEVHRVLMEKVFPRQATVTTTSEIVGVLQGAA